MKLLSEACEYGLRAVVWLSQCPPGPQKVKEIGEHIDAPAGYLIKVLQDLAKAGILSARRGSNGGFVLLSDPSELTPLDVINAIDPLERLSKCPLGLAQHGKNLCRMHQRIDDAMRVIEDSFRSVSIRDMIVQTIESGPSCRSLMHCGEKVDSRVQLETGTIPKQ